MFAHTHITVFIREHEGKAHLYHDKKGVEIPDNNGQILSKRYPVSGGYAAESGNTLTVQIPDLTDFYRTDAHALTAFTRCCGPEEGMRYHILTEWFEKHVAERKDILIQQKDMPPLIVHYVDGGFKLNDRNHKLEAYSRLSIKEYYVIVWVTEKEERKDFNKKYYRQR